MKLKTWMQRICLVVVFITVAGLACLRFGKDFTAEIREGKMGYTARFGWVNWGHSRPGRVRVFWQKLLANWKASNGKPFDVTYSQMMSADWKILAVESTFSRSYRVEDCRDERDLECIALGIFREVSDGFETMQGSFPNAIDARSQDSSFRGGDLHGNIIAFYRALRGYSEEQIREWVRPASIEDSLRMLHEEGVQHDHEWRVPAELAGGRLDQLQHDPSWFGRHVTFLGEHQTWFRFFIP